MLALILSTHVVGQSLITAADYDGGNRRVVGAYDHRDPITEREISSLLTTHHINAEIRTDYLDFICVPPAESTRTRNLLKTEIAKGWFFVGLPPSFHFKLKERYATVPIPRKGLWYDHAPKAVAKAMRNPLVAENLKGFPIVEKLAVWRINYHSGKSVGVAYRVIVIAKRQERGQAGIRIEPVILDGGRTVIIHGRTTPGPHRGIDDK